MNSTAGVPHSHSHVITQDYSALFFLDFLGRYAVDRCGAADTLITSFFSTVCILPMWIWISSFCLSLVKVELYWVLARYSLTLLTLFQLILLVIYDTPPPVLGCGPNQSFPSPQIALSAYAHSVFLSYKHLRSVDGQGSSGDQGGSEPAGQWLDLFMTMQYILVIHAVLWVGFSSPSSALAACASGALPAVALHQVVFVKTQQERGWLLNLSLWLESKLGVNTINTLFSAVDTAEQELCSLVTQEDAPEMPHHQGPPTEPEAPPSRPKIQPPVVATSLVTMGYTQ